VQSRRRRPLSQTSRRTARRNRTCTGPAGAQAGDTRSTPGKLAEDSVVPGSMPGGSAFTPSQSRTPHQNTQPVVDRWLYQAGRCCARHTGSHTGLAGFYTGRQPKTLPEHDSGKGPVAVPDWPAQCPSPPATNASIGKYCLKRSFLPVNFWRSVWQLWVVGYEKENRPSSHLAHRDYPS
jgi:hypothetical protein